MTDRVIRDIVNLLLYGGAFIGLCASSIIALTFELVGEVENHFSYILLIGVSTAALYSAHRVIGLHKLSHVTTSLRYSVIRKYKQHIWLYCLVWVAVSIVFLWPLVSTKFILWLMPGGIISLAYVVPLLPKGRRLRDLGWTKIVLIGWSWSWLTAFIPAYYFSGVPLHLSIVLGLERMMFIIAITIPFEIRDLAIDKSVGLLTMPSRFGMKRTLAIGRIFCFATMIFAMVSAFHFIDLSYFIAMSITCVLAKWLLQKSETVSDDYFFSGVTDGLMILAVVFYWVVSNFV